MSKAQAARTFSVSLSSVKRYVNRADRGESLVPKRRDPDLFQSSMRRRGSYSKMTSKNVPTSPFRIVASTLRS